MATLRNTIGTFCANLSEATKARKLKQAEKYDVPVRMSRHRATAERMYCAHYRFPSKPRFDENGQLVEQVITRDDVLKLFIAERLPNSPALVNAAFEYYKLEEAFQRRKHASATPAEPQPQPQAAAPITYGYISPARLREILGLSQNGHSKQVIEGNVIKFPTKPARPVKKSDAELAADVEELLQKIEPENRDLVRAYLQANPRLLEFAASGAGTLKLAVKNGQVLTGGYHCAPQNQ